MRMLAIVALLSGSLALAQGVRIDIPLQTSGPMVPSHGGPLPQALWLANSTVSICAHPATSISTCTPITTYTDVTLTTPCPTATPIVQLPGSACVATSGAKANLGFWYAGGIVDYFVQSSYGLFGPFTTSGGTTGPVGPAGPAGPVGPTGPPGSGNITASPQFSLFYQPSSGSQSVAQGDPNVTTDGSGNVVGLSLKAKSIGGSSYAKQFQSGGGNNGIANCFTAGNPNCVAGPDYAFTEFPGPFSFSQSPSGLQDLRGGQQTNVFHNPQVALGTNFQNGIYPLNGTPGVPNGAAQSGISNYCNYDDPNAQKPYCQILGVQDNMPGYTMGFPVGLTGIGWTSNQGLEMVMQSRNPGISGTLGILDYKDGTGDNDATYFTHHSRGGRTTIADEGHIVVGINGFEDADYNSTCVGGCTPGSQAIKTALGNAGNQGDWQYVTDTTQSPTTGNVTAIAAGLGGGSAVTVDATVPVSNAWGTIAALNVPVNKTPPFTTTETATVTVTSGTFVANTLVCFSGTAHEQAMPSSVSGSPPNQTLTFSTASNSGLRKSHVGASEIMQGGICGSGIEFPYYTTTGGAQSNRYVFDCIGSTDAHTLQCGLFQASSYGVLPLAAQATQIANFTNATASSGTTVSFVYTGAGSTIFHPWNFVGAGNNWIFTGSSDAALNATCTNPVWNADKTTGTCTIAGLTGTHTTTTPLVGMLGINAFKVWKIAETTDVQDYNETNCLATGTLAQPVHAPCVDGTFALEPNVVQFATSDGVEQLNNPANYMKAISPGLTTKNPFQIIYPINIGVNGYGNQGGALAGGSNSFIEISGQGVTNQFINNGGILNPMNLMNIQAAHFIGLNFAGGGPVSDQATINIQTTAAQQNNATYNFDMFNVFDKSGGITHYNIIPNTGDALLSTSRIHTISGSPVVISSDLGAQVFRSQVTLSPIAAPTLTVTPKTTGGSLADGTYFYQVQARGSFSYSPDSNEASCAISGGGGNGSCLLSWTVPAGSTSYVPSGRATSGGELNFPQQNGISNTTFIDTGSLTPSGAANASAPPPLAFNSGGTAFNTNVIATAGNGANNTVMLPSGSGTLQLAGQATPSQQFSAVAVGSLANYVQNSGTMSGTGWGSSGSTVATPGQTDPFGGTNAVSVATAINTDNYSNSGTAVTGGTSYTGCGWAKGAVGGEREGFSIGNVGTNVFLTTTWTLYSFTVTASTTATLRFNSINNVAQTVFLYGWNVVPATLNCLSPGYITGTPQPATVNTIVTPQLNNVSPQTTVGCATSGTAIFSQPEQGTSDKKVVIHLAACLGTASYTYPTAFTNSPSCYASSLVACSVAGTISTSAVTVTGTTSTGSLILEDF